MFVRTVFDGDAGHLVAGEVRRLRSELESVVRVALNLPLHTHTRTHTHTHAHAHIPTQLSFFYGNSLNCSTLLTAVQPYTNVLIRVWVSPKRR
jgi:hypothetical protein